MSDQSKCSERSAKNPWAALVDEILSGLVQDDYWGPDVDRRDLEKFLPPRPNPYTQPPFLFPQLDELSQYLADDFRAHFDAPTLPQSIHDLQRLLSEGTPNRLFHWINDGELEMPTDWESRVSNSELPFPSGLVADIQQCDVNILYETAWAEGSPGFERDAPLCYAWVAMQYYAVNAACSSKDLLFDVCGAPSTMAYQWLAPNRVNEINETLNQYSAAEVRDPAVFFLCAYASLMQSVLLTLRGQAQRQQARKDLNEAKKWATGLQEYL